VTNTKHRFIKNDFKMKEDLSNNNPSEYESTNIRTQLPIIWDKAKDFYVFDENGNKWIDLTSGIFVSNSGHSNPKINEAIKNQLDSDLCFSFFYPTKIRQELGKRLIEISPKHFEKVVLLNTGSEATDIAYKIIKTWAKKSNKKYIITFEGSYHGRVLSSDLICGDSKSSEWSNVVDDDVIFLKFPYDLDTKFDPRLLPPSDQIAAFFLETYQGWGAWMYPQDYIKDLYDFARKSGALVCFDEIQSGFYRMGTLYGYMIYGDYLKPDIICTGKAISAPLPMSAVISTKDLIDNTEKLGGTHAGNPLCCAAALANIDFFEDQNFQNELSEKVKIFEKRLKSLKRYDSINTVNVKGLVAAIIFHNPDDATKVILNCVNEGVMPMNTWSTSIKIGPPLTITIEALNEAIDVIEKHIKGQNDN